MNMKTISFAGGLAAIVLSSVGSPAHGQALHEYGITIAGQDQEAEVFINGFPYLTLGLDIGSTHTEIVTRFLLEGTNEIIIHCTDQSDPGGEKLSGLCSIRLEERVGESGGVTTVFNLDRQCDPDELDPSKRDETHTLTTGSAYNLEARSELGGAVSDLQVDLAAEASTYGYDRSGRGYNRARILVSLPDAPVDSLPWQGQPVDLDPAGQQQVRELVGDVHDAFLDRDSTTIVSLLSQKVGRSAVAMGKTEEEMTSILRDFYDQQVFTIPNLTFDAFEASTLDFIVFPDINLVEAVVDGGAPITASGDDILFSLRVYLSFVDGQWQIVE